MKLAIQQLSAAILVVIGFIAYYVLINACFDKSINAGQFILGMAVTTLGLLIDILWIGKHFVDGEWV